MTPPADDNDKTRAIRALAAAFDEYQRAVAQSIQDRRTGWLRLHIKVDRGRLMKVQAVNDFELFDHATAFLDGVDS